MTNRILLLHFLVTCMKSVQDFALLLCDPKKGDNWPFRSLLNHLEFLLQILGQVRTVEVAMRHKVHPDPCLANSILSLAMATPLGSLASSLFWPNSSGRKGRLKAEERSRSRQINAGADPHVIINLEMASDQ